MSKRKERQAAEAATQLRAALQRHLEYAKSFDGATAAEVPGCPLQTHAGERIYLNASGAYLIEPRRGPGHYAGSSQGISVHVPGTRSMRYRVGANRGTFVQGDERPAPIDSGTFVITNQRAVFIGAKQTREWAWSKLIGFTHATDLPWTSIAVSNRQKNSGVLYDTATEDDVRFMLDLASARAVGDASALVAQIEGELAALAPAPIATEPPGTPALPPSAPDASHTERQSAPVAGWYADPSGRHELRFWEGARWTDQVADHGSQSVDPAQ